MPKLPKRYEDLKTRPDGFPSFPTDAQGALVVQPG